MTQNESWKPFVIKFRVDRQRRTRCWTRFSVSLAAAKADALMVLEREYYGRAVLLDVSAKEDATAGD